MVPSAGLRRSKGKRIWTRAPRVLIVDDSAFERSHAKAILTAAGFEVAAEAINGMDGVEKFQAMGPDLVLMNVVMPYMSGIEATAQIRRLRRKALVVASDSAVRGGLAEACIGAGAIDFVARPYLADRLVVAARRALGIQLPLGFEAGVEARERAQAANRRLPRTLVITVSGPAIVRERKTAREVVAPAVLEELDGATDAEVDQLASFIDPDHPLAFCGLTGGTLRLRYHPASRTLRVESEYQSGIALTPDRLAALIEYTAGQWSNGAGESYMPEQATAHDLIIMLNPSHRAAAAVAEIRAL